MEHPENFDGYIQNAMEMDDWIKKIAESNERKIPTLDEVGKIMAFIHAEFGEGIAEILAVSNIYVASLIMIQDHISIEKLMNDAFKDQGETDEPS